MNSGKNPDYQRSSLKDYALVVVRQALVTGEMEPGVIYSAAKLSRHLGMSNSPVREAMLALVEQGLMEPIANRGFRVVPMSTHDLSEIYYLRTLVEVPAVRDLAGLDISQHEKELRKLADDTVAAADALDITAFLETDRSFHLSLLQLTGNSRLVNLIGQLRDQSRLYGIQIFADPTMLRARSDEHRKLLDLVLAGDADAAGSLMAHHLEHVKSDWVNLQADTADRAL